MRTSILYEDKHIIVIYKPAGLATQTSRVGQADVVSELKNYLEGGYVGVVHRLDQPVEGLLVFGKAKEATAALTSQLTKGVLNKHYYAVVCGQPAASSGELVDYLIKTPDNRAEVVEPPQKAGTVSGKSADGAPKKAMLNYRILEHKYFKEAELSLVDIYIQTGRFHQIRAQMSHAGLPLLGDQKYGTELSAKISRELTVRNVALCAYELTLQHPISGEELSFQIAPKGAVFGQFSIKG